MDDLATDASRPGHHPQPPPDLLAVNGFFTALGGYAHATTPNSLVVAASALPSHLGPAPPAPRFGHWLEQDTVVGFLLECHRHEQLSKDLIATLAG